MEIDNPEMSFYQLPTEIWIEIFRYVDIPCLIDLSRVCKHWNRLIFTHFVSQIEFNLDTTKRKRPPRDIGTASERYYKHLYLRSETLNSSVDLFGMVKQMAVHLDTLELNLVTLECKDLVQLLAVCTRMNKLCISAYRAKCSDTNHTMRLAMLSAVRYLSFGVIISDAKCHLHKILQKMPNVKELKTRLYRPLDLTIFILYPELKILRVTVSGKTINDFLRLRWPALEELELTLLETGEFDWFIERNTEPQALQRFLLGCKSLKVASFDYEHGQQLLTVILTSLPHVEELKLSATCMRRAEWYSFDGMERMKCLKTLSISGQVNVDEEEQVVQIPTVERLSIHTLDKEHGDVLKRFPNLKSLSMNGGLVEPVAELIPLLEELTVFEFSCIESDMVEYVQEFINLKTLNIYCDYIDKRNLILLCDIMVRPEMKCLNVWTNNIIPPDVASLVAASNTTCKFILNDKLVTTVPSCRRSERKRKLTANV